MAPGGHAGGNNGNMDGNNRNAVLTSDRMPGDDGDFAATPILSVRSSGR